MYDESYKRKVGRGSNFNYDLFPLINNFSFCDLVDYALEQDKKDTEEKLEDYGAFFVITDKQYIIGYTAGNGAGTHKSAFARVQKELQGGGVIATLSEAKILTEKCLKNNITARIYYAKSYLNNFLNYSGHIDIDLTDSIITPEKFELFKQLYYKYNDELLYLSSKGKGFQVEYIYLEKNKVLRHESTSLDSLYLYLEQNINKENTNNSNDEIIIGETIKKITK